MKFQEFSRSLKIIPFLKHDLFLANLKILQKKEWLEIVNTSNNNRFLISSKKGT